MNNDERLDEVQDLARGLHRDREELAPHFEALSESLAEMHREPTTSVEFTEKELRGLVAILYDYDGTDSLVAKVDQALAIETGDGGKFSERSPRAGGSK